MAQKYSFKEKMTGRKKCPGCGQREIPLSGDSCDLCNDNLAGKHDLVKEYRKNNPNDTRKIFEKNGELYVYIEDNLAQEHKEEEESIETAQSTDWSPRKIFWWAFILFFCIPLILVISSGGTSILGWIVIAGYIFLSLWYYLLPINVERRRREREEEECAAREKKEQEQEQKELEYRLEKEIEIKKYRQLRKEIEAMPEYKRWRQAVFEKFSKECSIGGSACSSAIEVDHRYESFYSIIKKYKITNTVEAYECAALWNVNNGAPLCKLHHDQTKSSLYHKENKY